MADDGRQRAEMIDEYRITNNERRTLEKLSKRHLNMEIRVNLCKSVIIRVNPRREILNILQKKANSPRFYAKNRDSQKKQSQTKPIQTQFLALAAPAITFDVRMMNRKIRKSVSIRVIRGSNSSLLLSTYVSCY